MDTKESNMDVAAYLEDVNNEEIVVFVSNQAEAEEIKAASKRSGYGDIVNRIITSPEELKRYMDEHEMFKCHPLKELWFGVKEAKDNLGEG